ncbi:UPF0725 protein At1g23970 [Eutrema salsugineum]|uniref:UPF0725 protein At1g23970 n=1 Tax=Eutrema salsugineum TaxID=72664 RepID=UPI000CED6025|nr:UPF0725 protein At1g23970 [Eutrema salsugineum]
MYGLINGLLPFNCTNNRRYPYRFVVNLYAKVGLHRYNMLEGTSFKHSALMKFNMVGGFMSSFYMTLLAHNPDPAASTLQKTFQVRVDEGTFGSLDITCSIARPKDEVTTKTPFIPHFHGGTAADGIFKGELPDWPSDDAFNDGKRFYMVKESEWQATDWIHMYLELVIASHCRSADYLSSVLSQLEIVKVAIETAIEDVESPKERLNAKIAHVYIKFKGLAEPQVPRQVFEIGEHVERKAIVRRVISKHTGYLTLMGKLCGGTLKHPRVEIETESCKKRPCLG